MADSVAGRDPSVAVLLLNWRQAELTEACLADLTAAADRRVHILVMDNGSGDGSSDRLRAAVDATCRASGPSASGPAAVELVAFDENLGYCGAMNRGIQWAAERGLELVLMLNNDMRLPADFLWPLVDVLRNDPQVVCVGPTIVTPDGLVWAQGGTLAFAPNVVRLRGQGRPPLPRDHGPEAVDFVPGACALFRLADLQAVGCLDEGYFMYWEDVELCRRLADRGGTILWLPWISVTHAGSQSSGGGRSPLRKFMMGANALRYLRRHGTARNWLSFLVMDCLLWPLSLLTTGPRAALAKARGIGRGVLGRRVTVADVRRYIAD